MGRSFERIGKAMPIQGHFVSHRFCQYKEKNPYHLAAPLTGGRSTPVNPPQNPTKPNKTQQNQRLISHLTGMDISLPRSAIRQ
jgi:hypothetical protein